MDRLQTELDDLKEDYDELSARHQGLLEHNEDLRDQHDQLKGGIKKLQKEIKEHKEENYRLRLRDCKTIIEGEDLESPDQPEFLDEVIEDLQGEQDEEEVLPGMELPESLREEDEVEEGALKSWGSLGGRAKFQKGSQMRVNNKAFIKNQLEKQDYVSRDADYRHGGDEHMYNSDYNSYYVPVTRRRGKTSFNTFTCSTFDYDCQPCTTAE